MNRLNNGDGIALYDSPNNTIGGSTAAAANVISGNGGDGILVSSLDNGPGSTDTLIEGNYIGIDATGSIEVGNGNNGVHLVYGAGTIVGGLSTHDRNIISGNQAGVYLENSATGMSDRRQLNRDRPAWVQGDRQPVRRRAPERDLEHRRRHGAPAPAT